MTCEWISPMCTIRMARRMEWHSIGWQKGSVHDRLAATGYFRSDMVIRKPSWELYAWLQRTNDSMDSCYPITVATKYHIFSFIHHLPTLHVLTRSLPRDVYIRRQNDHPGGQGRIYTSHLNFVSTHLSKPGHRRGCCCMSPRCLLHQFVVRCLLFWAFFIEKTVLLCFARFLSNRRETALWMFPDATSWY